MLAEILPILLMGFGLGLAHALDADHIMAVTALHNAQSNKPNVLRVLGYCAYWAAGHGAVLLMAGLLLFGVGMALPEWAQKTAEVSVGVLLIILGFVFFFKVNREKIAMERHTHGDVEHIHWHKPDHAEGKGSHKPVMVGVLHGLAGSAPALAVIPAVAAGELSIALGYLVLFSIGVMLSMLAFGLGLGSLQQFLLARFQWLSQLSRHLIAGLSVLMGSYWIFQAV